MSEKIIIFDSGPIISLAMARLLWILDPLKKRFGGRFYIPPKVKEELVTKPLQIKRFGFEALQVMKLIREGVLEVYSEVPQQEIEELMSIANRAFSIKGKRLEIVQEGEMEAVAIYRRLNADALVMDERTMRLLIENHQEVRSLLEYRFKQKVSADLQTAQKFDQQLGEIKVIRSIELVIAAYKYGILDGYIPKLKEGKKILLDAVLWNVKFNGCAVTGKEIEEIEKYLLEQPKTQNVFK